MISLPPLPEHFGNPALEGLVEIEPLSTIDWMPQTPGWYLLLGGSLLFLTRLGWRGVKRWYRNRYRREALRQLKVLQHLPATQQVTAANRLLKTVAITASSRASVAKLDGDRWREWLSTRCEPPVLSEATLLVLSHGIYHPAPPAPPQSFIAELQNWIRRHRDDHG